MDLNFTCPLLDEGKHTVRSRGFRTHALRCCRLRFFRGAVWAECAGCSSVAASTPTVAGARPRK